MRSDSASVFLRRARRRSGLTQQALARKVGIPQSVLSAYERGRRQPSVTAAVRILEAAGFRLALKPRVDEVRAGVLLRQLLDLADALPKRRRGELRYPPLR
jgi:transcriptional regulator with XRE-family HTH domain